MTLTIALAQVNPHVGDVAGNTALVRRVRDEAAAQGADLVVFPELVLVGYPPEDLVLRPALVDAAAEALRDLERESADARMPGVVVTLPWRDDGRLRNAVALVAGGRSELRFKHALPNYGVFDEKRVFDAGPLPEPVTFRGLRLGVPICEDIWSHEVAAHLVQRGARLLLVPNGSPFDVEKFAHRLELARMRTAETGIPLGVRQPGWRPGRAGVRRRILRDESCRIDRVAASFLARGDDAHALAGHRRERRVRWRHHVVGAAADRVGLLRHGARTPRLRAQEPLSRRGPGAVGRHRLGADRRGRG